MLTHLQINNFILINQVELDFNSGLTVITGETGSGKSIIIDALSLLLGSKTDSSMVGNYAEKCNLIACFNLINSPQAIEWLTSNELHTQDHDECIIRRVIDKEGKSRQMINGINCTLQQLRELATYLIHLHSQNQHQQLTKRSHQRELLDGFSHHSELCDKVKRCYQTWSDNQVKIERLQKHKDSAAMQQDLLQYQLSELDKANILPNEYQLLDAEHKILANAGQLIQNCQQLLHLLSEGDPRSAQDFLYQAQSTLANIVTYDEKLQSANDLLSHAIIHLEEAIGELRDYSHQVESNPERLHFVEQRLAKLHELARKYQVSPTDLDQVQAKIQTALEENKDITNQLEELRQETAILIQDYQQAAKELTKSRQMAAEKLTVLISSEMQSLGMSGGIFQVKLSTVEHFNQHGLDEIEFLVSTNPGQSPQSLTKIASGGEISRISLAIYVATAQRKTTPILVFDEVDVGIGGGTAAIVGRLLKSIGQTAQVLCVTHLPQVAAYGNHHLSVVKHIGTNQTSTTIVQLQKDEIIQEIARMLGGLTITEKTLAHARELIANN